MFVVVVLLLCYSPLTHYRSFPILPIITDHGNHCLVMLVMKYYCLTIVTNQQSLALQLSIPDLMDLGHSIESIIPEGIGSQSSTSTDVSHPSTSSHSSTSTTGSRPSTRSQSSTSASGSRRSTRSRSFTNTTGSHPSTRSRSSTNTTSSPSAATTMTTTTTTATSSSSSSSSKFVPGDQISMNDLQKIMCGLGVKEEDIGGIMALITKSITKKVLSHQLYCCLITLMHCSQEEG